MLMEIAMAIIMFVCKCKQLSGGFLLGHTFQRLQSSPRRQSTQVFSSDKVGAFIEPENSQDTFSWKTSNTTRRVVHR